MDTSVNELFPESRDLSIPRWPQSSMKVRTLDDSLHSTNCAVFCARVAMRRNLRALPPTIRGISDTAHSAPAQWCVSRENVNLSVKFSSIEIREYPMELGDNPSVSSGPPITIGWEPQMICEPVDLETYESNHPPRRSNLEMSLPLSIRKEILSNSNGMTPRQIVAGTKNVNLERARRKRSGEMQHLDAVKEKMERTKRGLKNAIIRGRKKKERDLLKRATVAEKEAERRRAEAWAAEEKLLGKIVIS